MSKSIFPTKRRPEKTTVWSQQKNRHTVQPVFTTRKVVDDWHEYKMCEPRPSSINQQYDLCEADYLHGGYTSRYLHECID